MLNPDQILVITKQKGFWKTRHATIFSNRWYLPEKKRWFKQIHGCFLCLKLIRIARLKNIRVIVFATSLYNLTGWFCLAKRFGFCSQTKVVVAHKNFKRVRTQFVDKIITYSRDTSIFLGKILAPKCNFIPWPYEEVEYAKSTKSKNGYIFSGGVSKRDFASLIEAVKELNIQVKIITQDPKFLKYGKSLPANCSVSWKKPFSEWFECLSNSLFVVVPLEKSLFPHGHREIASALRLGKAIISTKEGSVDDYLQDGVEGILVRPRDVEGYRKAILTMVYDEAFRKKCEQNALKKAEELSPEKFGERVMALCRELVN